MANKQKGEWNRVYVDFAASGVANKERLNMPMIAMHEAT
ncbi:TPA: DNA polymerase III subunit theta [Klebsiella michiganensis]